MSTRTTKRPSARANGAGKALALLALATCAACTTPGDNVNPPLQGQSGRPFDIASGYRLQALDPGPVRPDTLILLAFSGGGKRSAAFSYGSLRGLAETRIVGRAGSLRLLDQVSGISGVSGGSFTAAYYGLHRDRIFTQYEKDFLKQDIEAYIYGTYFAPWNWRWMVDATYGTNDRMAQVYDRLMFHGATYADLQKRGRPVIVAQATDVSYGIVFPFTQDSFDLLCSDLSTYPIARAVAASNGFPVLFTPITLINHSSQCNGQEPAWLKSAEADRDPQSRRRYLARQARLYLNADKTRYVHLMDGGVADNLALRSYIEQVERFADFVTEGTDDAAVRGLLRTRRVLLVVVDGEAAPDSNWPRRRVLGGFAQVLSAVSGSQIDRYNFETLIAARAALDKFKGVLVAARCRRGRQIDGYDCSDVQVFLEHISLDRIEDPAVRSRLASIPTGLTIPDADVDLLVDSGRRLIGRSPVIRAFVDSYRLGARIAVDR
jgi:NTE family protein